jgi:hypothetical protein
MFSWGSNPKCLVSLFSPLFVFSTMELPPRPRPSVVSSVRLPSSVDSSPVKYNGFPSM